MDNDNEIDNDCMDICSPEGNSDDSVFRIFISTDNHLGYKENDSVRGNDSFDAFDEVLELATKEPNLDFVLLGGDLFHEFKPSRTTFLKTYTLFKKYVFGEQNIDFRTCNYQANYTTLSETQIERIIKFK